MKKKQVAARIEMEEMRATYEGRLREREEEGAAAVAQLRAEMEARFSSADTDASGSLNYSEFVTLLQSLRGEALEPLRQAFTSGLQA